MNFSKAGCQLLTNCSSCMIVYILSLLGLCPNALCHLLIKYFSPATCFMHIYILKSKPVECWWYLQTLTSRREDTWKTIKSISIFLGSKGTRWRCHPVSEDKSVLAYHERLFLGVLSALGETFNSVFFVAQIATSDSWTPNSTKPGNSL